MSAILRSRLPAIIGSLAVVVDDAVIKGAHLVQADAERRLAPHRRTGELEQQVHVDDQKREGVYVVAGEPTDPSFAFWGHMLEHGTSHSPPYPFLVPALEENEERIKGMVIAAVRSVT